MAVGRNQRIVRDRYQRLQIRIDAPQQRPKVVVLPEEGMKPSAHGDLIMAMNNRPGTHPPTELIMRFDHDHWHSAFGQPDGSGDAGNAAACDNDRLGKLGQPWRTSRRGVTNGASIPPRSPTCASPNDHEAAEGLRARTVCRIPRCQPGMVRTSTSTKPARYKRSTKV